MNPTKKTRAFPRVWAWFYSLPKFESFDFGGKTQYTKTGIFSAEFKSCPGAGGGYKTRLVWPFTKVRTSVLVRDARPGGKSSLDKLDAILTEANARPSDPCCETVTRNPDGSAYRGTNYDHPQTEQPHNDNSVHGPTS